MPVLALAAMLAALPGALSSGCQTDEQIQALRKDVLDLKDQNKKLQEQLNQLQNSIGQRDEQVRTLQGLGDKRLEKLIHVAAINITSRTGGIETDGKPGDDAIKVFIEPRDSQTSIIKAAASVKIQLYDLAAPKEENLIGEFTWSVDEAAKNWYDGFMSYYYSFVCPWKTPPQHPEITVRVEFLDYLTGKTFTAQTICKINLAASAPKQP